MSINKRNPRGAGRKACDPALKKKQFGTRLSPFLIKWMSEHEKPSAVLIEEALIGWNELEKPD